jgi:hypothetical protein
MLAFLPVHAGFCCSVVTISAQLARTFTIELTYANKPLEMPVSISDIRTGEVVRSVKTDAHGHGEIHDLEPGTYNIVSPVSNDVAEVLPRGGVDMLRVVARFDHAPIEVAHVMATITDVTGAVIPKAVVVLEAVDDSRSPVAAGTTDASGSISLETPQGEYLLRVASPGFHTALVPIRVTKDGWPAFTLVLQIGSCPGQPPGPLSIKRKE